MQDESVLLFGGLIHLALPFPSSQSEFPSMTRPISSRFAVQLATSLLGITLIISSLSAQDSNKDWLVDPSGFVANVRIDEQQKRIVLENGLAQRTLSLSPGLATTSLLNQSTGEEYIRAIAPEGKVIIDGEEYMIGGLEGQPVMNYFKEEWLSEMKPMRNSYKLAAWEVSEITARFPWKRREKWCSQNLNWPPKGKHLKLTFAPPKKAAASFSGPSIQREEFKKPLSETWTIVKSQTHSKTSISSTEQGGLIYAVPDTVAYAETNWPKTGAAITMTLDTGDDDYANSWGPGMALVFDDQVVCCVARPQSEQFELVSKETGERLVGKFKRGEKLTIRAALLDNRVNFDAVLSNKSRVEIGSVRVGGIPSKVRIGKVGKAGKGSDYPTATGEYRSSHIHDVNFLASPSSPDEIEQLPLVEVHYELYDGLPLFSKWLVLKNSSERPYRLDSFTAEQLRIVEPESTVESAPDSEEPNLWVESDYSFGAMDARHAIDKGVRYVVDEQYSTQVHYDRQTRCLLECKPEFGPGVTLEPSETFESFRVFELLLDSTDRERRGLAQRRMYRTIAPWTAENPLMFHVRSASPDSIRRAIQQCDEVGFELIIMTFGSGFNFESRDPKYQAEYRTLALEAHAKGIELGGYSLLASRGAGTAEENTQGFPAKYGVMPCLGAQWGRDYLEQLRSFLLAGELGVLEHDGSYPGDRCAAENHPHHRNAEDSQWVQWRAITDFYKECRSLGIFLNIPDWYFLAGGNKCGMGYRETNWSLPRAEQEIIERQNIFDGTWTKSVSMGWMMVPLTEYHGGGAAATIEPLHEHVDHYESRLANLLGAGVQACYRGPRLFDTDDTKRMVKKWVDFYKTHREVLDGDLIHLRRANGRDWDGWLHVNPQGKERGLAMLYNPLPTPIERTIRLPLYYTGIRGEVRYRIGDLEWQTTKLDDSHSIELHVTIPAQNRIAVVLE